MATRRENHSKLVVILGPTAAGKSRLAVALAKKFRGEIVSADSRQVYRGMDIGTGKITPAEAQGVPHYLLDIVSPRTRFDVVRYQKKALRAIKNIQSRQHLPFLVGGSPFYLYSIIEGWRFPKVGSLPSLRRELSQKPLPVLQERLKSLDPDYFKKVEKANPRRLIRAIEIATQLGRVPPRQRQSLFHSLIIGLQIPWPKLKERIAQRLQKRFRQGMIQEVVTLHRQGISWKRLEDFGLEYRWISYYLQGKLTKKEMAKKLQKEIEKFAKRQMTWFKRDQRIHWVKNKKEAEALIKSFLQQSEV